MADPKSMSVPELMDFMQKVQDGASRDAAMREALLEIGTAMADMLAAAEKSGPEMVKAFAASLRELRLELKAPDIHINVKPTPVEVKVEPVIQVAAPAGAKKLLIEATPTPGGGFSMTVTKA